MPPLPLRQKLIDSGLGTALSDSSGFDLDLRDTMFACGLKEIEADCRPQGGEPGIGNP